MKLAESYADVVVADAELRDAEYELAFGRGTSEQVEAARRALAEAEAAWRRAGSPRNAAADSPASMSAQAAPSRIVHGQRGGVACYGDRPSVKRRLLRASGFSASRPQVIVGASRGRSPERRPKRSAKAASSRNSRGSPDDPDPDAAERPSESGLIEPGRKPEHHPPAEADPRSLLRRLAEVSIDDRMVAADAILRGDPHLRNSTGTGAARPRAVELLFTVAAPQVESSGHDEQHLEEIAEEAKRRTLRDIARSSLMQALGEAFVDDMEDVA